MAPLRYAAKFDPFLSLDWAPTPSTLAQSKERKGSNFAIWQPWPECRITKSVGAAAAAREPGEERLYYTFPLESRLSRESHKYILFDICIRIRVVGRGAFLQLAISGGAKRRWRRSLLASHSWREICRTKHGEKLPPTGTHLLARSRRREQG